MLPGTPARSGATAAPAADPAADEAAGAGPRAAAAAKRGALLAGLGLILLFFAGLGAAPLGEPDEGRYAEIPREMLATGDFVSPRLEGVLYFEKPPLYYWLEAAVMGALGVGEVAARLTSALLGFAGLGLAWAMGRSIGGARVGLVSALILGTSVFYVALARMNTIDMTASFFIAATLVCFWLAHREAPGRRRFLLWLAAFAAAALAVLSKGLIGIVLPGAIAFLYLVGTRQWRVFREVPWVRATLVFLALAVPWHVLMARRHADFLWFYFVREHFLRYTTPEAERWQPVWYFLPVLAVGLLPWSGLLPAAVPLLRGADPRQRGAQFLVTWAGFIVLFFSASHSKIATYVLPAALPLAVLGALAADAAPEAGPRARAVLRWGSASMAVLLAVLAAAVVWIALGRVPKLTTDAMPAVAAAGAASGLVAVVAAVTAWRGGRRAVTLLGVAAMAWCGALVLATPVVAARRSSDQLAAVLRERLRPGDEVAALACFPESLAVYLGRGYTIVDYRGELTFGITHLTPAERLRRFPTIDEFRPRWKSARPIFAVVDEPKLPRLSEAGLAPQAVLARQGKVLLVANTAAAAALAERKRPMAAGTPGGSPE